MLAEQVKYFKAQQEVNQKYSYDITQKLTYFIITIELAFCGYMLLNADEVSELKGSSYLFMTCGVAALLGILWRFAYNISFHSYAHGQKELLSTKAAKASQSWLHGFYALFSVISLIWAVISGFIYLQNYPMPHKAQEPNEGQQIQKKTIALQSDSNKSKSVELFPSTKVTTKHP